MAIRTAAELKTNMPIGGVGQTSVSDIHDIVDTFDSRAPALIKPPFRPEVYGAKFDGTTNDTTAWSAMFADITTQGYGEVKMPAGKTVITSGTLNIPKRCSIVGQGRRVSQFLRATGTNGPLMRANGTHTWDDRKQEVSLSELGFEGQETATGPLLQAWYLSQSRLDNVRFEWNGGPAIQFMCAWDSQFSNIYIQDCSKNGVVSTDDGSVVGDESVQFWGALTASGVGYTDDSNNNLAFYSLHIENTVAPGITMRKGPNPNTSATTHQIRFYGLKYETAPFFASQYMIHVGSSTANIVFHDAYIACMAQNNASFLTTTRPFRIQSRAQFVFTDSTVFIAAGGFVDRVFDCDVSAGWRHRIENIMVDGTMPTTTVISINNSQNIPWARIFSSGGTNPGLTPTSPVYAAT